MNNTKIITFPRGVSIDPNEEDIDEVVAPVKEVFEYLEHSTYCHVKVIGGDYDGSVAIFTPDELITGDERLYWGNFSGWYNTKYYLDGRLSWEGKRNNPKFRIMHSTCKVLLNYEGPTIFKMFDIKAEGDKLLQNTLYDIDAQPLSVGDKVLYMNLRYGCGGKLCRGQIESFKPHPRKGYLSVIILGEDGRKSDLNYPHYQILKL